MRQLTNTAGAVTDTYEYDAWGNEVNSTGTTSNSYLYRGEQYDSDLGLYYLRARYMNPLTGRFMSMDPQQYKPINPEKYQPLKSNRKPLDPMKWHRYLYAGANPVNMLDPRGREELGDEAGALEDAEALAEEESYKLKTLMEYRLDLLRRGGYEIGTDGTESFADEVLDDFIKMWNNK